jgi:hypothetical protein
LQFLQALQFFAPVQVASAWVRLNTVKESKKAEMVKRKRVNIVFFINMGFSADKIVNKKRKS